MREAPSLLIILLLRWEETVPRDGWSPAQAKLWSKMLKVLLLLVLVLPRRLSYLLPRC